MGNYRVIDRGVSLCHMLGETGIKQNIKLVTEERQGSMEIFTVSHTQSYIRIITFFYTGDYGLK